MLFREIIVICSEKYGNILMQTTHKYFNIENGGTYNNHWALRSSFVVKGPQQMLRMHWSFEAYCATLWWRWLVFVLEFPCNGAPMEWNWQGKIEVLGEEPAPVPLCLQQIPHGLTLDRNRASVARFREFISRQRSSISDWILLFYTWTKA
jgi:hypothetical protein